MAIIKNKRPETLAPYIENTLLKANASLIDVIELCEQSIELGFRGVCVPPCFVDNAKLIIKPSPLLLITVVGFPLGYNTTAAKAEEVKKALQQGADEVDAVMNVAAFLSGKKAYVREEISTLVTLCRLQGKKLKLIIETCLLTNEQIIEVCELAVETHVDYIKTSTGFNGPGASVDNIKLLRANLPDTIKIKASGGINTKELAESLILAGADIIGTSSGSLLL